MQAQEDRLQSGFDCGYTEGFSAGLEVGRVRGILAAARLGADQQAGHTRLGEQLDVLEREYRAGSLSRLQLEEQLANIRECLDKDIS